MPNSDTLVGVNDPRFDNVTRMMRESFGMNTPQTLVPAVELTTAQWRAIVEIILDLADLVDETCPNAVETALIQGKVISESAQKAYGLMHSMRLDEWYAHNERVLEMARQKRKAGSV